MKKSLTAILLITLTISLAGCQKNEHVLWITSGINDYWTYMSTTPGIELTAVFTRDLKNSDLKYHWVAEQGTFLMWHGSDSIGRIEDLGNDIITNIHKLYWAEGAYSISEKSFTVYLTIEDISTSEVIAETSIQIEHPEEGHFIIDQ